MTETTGKTCLPCCCAWMPVPWPLPWRPGRWRARRARPAWPRGDTAGNGRSGCAHRGQLFPAPRHRDQISATMTTNPPPDARNARIYVATANVAVMDILSGGEHLRSSG